MVFFWVLIAFDVQGGRLLVAANSTNETTLPVSFTSFYKASAFWDNAAAISVNHYGMSTGIYVSDASKILIGVGTTITYTNDVAMNYIAVGK